MLRLRHALLFCRRSVRVDVVRNLFHERAGCRQRPSPPRPRLVIPSKPQVPSASALLDRGVLAWPNRSVNRPERSQGTGEVTARTSRVSCC